MTTQTLETKQNICPQAQTQQIQGLPVDTAVVFSDHKGRYKKRLEKQQLKLLGGLGFLSAFLKAGEKVLLVTTGCSPFSSSEQLLSGNAIFYLKRCLLVFTNNRIFHIPTNQYFVYRNSIAHIFYGDCVAISMKSSHLITEYRTGKKEKFTCIPRIYRRKIKLLLSNISLQGQSNLIPERTHLCPRCSCPLIKNHFTCPVCSLKFKNKFHARKISIIYPAGGYFYTRHPFMGLGNALVEIILLFAVITNVINAFKGITGDLIIAGLFVAALAADKTLTIFHSNMFIDEFIPIDLNLSAQPGLAQSNTPQPQPEDILRPH